MAIFIELLLIGVGLSMDAFAVSICKGLAMRRVNKKQALVIGLFFGGFQALMPFIGWALGTQFESFWVSAFGSTPNNLQMRLASLLMIKMTGVRIFISTSITFA